jgi:hypothetical protein
MLKANEKIEVIDRFELQYILKASNRNVERNLLGSNQWGQSDFLRKLFANDSERILPSGPLQIFTEKENRRRIKSQLHGGEQGKQEECSSGENESSSGW